MAEPWEDYAVASPPAQGGPRKATVWDDSSGIDNEGNDITVDPETGLEVTVTDDSPVGELPAAAPTPVPGDPTAEYGLPGLEGSVTYDGTGLDPEAQQPDTPPEEVGTGESIWEGVKGGALMGFGDEIQGFGGGVGSLLSGRGYMSGYEAERDAARKRSDDSWATNPWAYGTGYVPGTLLSVFATGGKGPAANAGLMSRMGYGARQGAMFGGVGGVGHADGGFADRAVGGAAGAALGAPLGAFSVPLTDLVGNVAGRAYRGSRNLFSAGDDTSGLNALAVRAPQLPEAMRAEAQRMQQAGVPPRLVDVVDESGRGVIRDAAGKMTPARDEVARHADDVYVSMQDRVAEQARRNISGAPQTARQMQRDIVGDPVAGTQGSRSAAMGEAMEPVRGAPVPLNDEVKAIFATREGQAALRGAEGLMTNPEERAVVRQVLAASRRAAKAGDAPPVDPDVNYAAQVPGWAKLPEATREEIRKQLPDLRVEAVDPWDGVQLTVDMADKIARAMKGRATKTPGLERVARDFGNAIRGSARDANEGYAGALDDYAARSGVADAAGGTGKFDESTFLSSPPDSYATAVQAASPNAPEGLGASELAALRARARDEVVDRATSGGGQNAPATARQLARGTAQNARSEALLGPEAARGLREGMDAEVTRLDNTRFIEPRTGSQTQSRGQDAVVDGFADAAANAASGGKWAIVRTAAKWLRQGGIRGIDAERLARDAISEDPARLEAAISYLTQKGMARARAERFVAKYASALSGAAAGSAQEPSE